MYDCNYNKPIFYITGRYNDVCGIQISKGERAHYRRSSLGHTFPYDLPKKGPVPKVQKLYPGQIHPSENRPDPKRSPVLQGSKYEVKKAASFA